MPRRTEQDEEKDSGGLRLAKPKGSGVGEFKETGDTTDPRFHDLTQAFEIQGYSSQYEEKTPPDGYVDVAALTEEK